MSDIEKNNAVSQDEEPKIYALKSGNEGINFTRRDFLKAAGIVTSATLAGCANNNNGQANGDQPEPEPEPTATEIQPSADFTNTELVEMCVSAKAHNENLGDFIYSPDGQTVVSSGDTEVKIWSLPEFALLKTIESGEYPRLAFSPDGSMLLVATAEGELIVISSINWQIIEKMSVDPIRDLKFIDDGQQLLTISKFGSISLYTVPDFDLLNTADTMVEEHSRLIVSPDETMLASLTYTSQRIYLWSLPDLEKLEVFTSNAEYLFRAAFSPDSLYLVAPGRENYVLIWSLPDGEQENELDVEHRVSNMMFTPDGEKLILSGGGETSLWSFPELEFLKSYKGSLYEVIENGSALLIGQENAIEIVPFSTDEEIFGISLREEEDFFVSMSPAGNTLAVIYYQIGAIEIYSLPSGKLALCLMDVASSPPEVEGIEVEVEVEGQVVTYTLPCGSPIPAGAVCTCNCVAGLGAPICSCVGHTTCSCVGHTSGGTHYWYPN